MEMDVRYRKYGENESLLIKLGIGMIIGFICLQLFEKVLKLDSDIIIIGYLLYLSFLGVIPVMLRAKNRFIANDFNVTFIETFSSKVVINYLDIEEIKVYNEMRSVMKRGGHINFYVEIIVFKTFDGKEYTFKTIMDVNPDSRLGIMLGQDKIFEMGKFKLLQKFIQQKKLDFS